MVSKGIRALKDKPEPLLPVKHGYLWRVSKLLTMQSWTVRWYVLDPKGFAYSKSPQSIGAAKSVFDIKSALVGAQIEEKVQTKDGAMMWGITVLATSGEKITLYSDERMVRDQWARVINANARAEQFPLFLDDNYTVDYDKPLGTGLFAIVLQGEQKATKLPVAIKVIKADAYREYKDLVDREVLVWHALGVHPNVVKLVEVLYSNKRVYFVAELLSGGNLVDSIAASDGYTEADVASYVKQLLEGVRHCHNQGISHMDLKPENIVLANKSREATLKVIDFSLASFFHTPTEPGGTPEFVAPELLIDPEFYADKGVGPSIDMWAVGIITYYLLCGKTPFHASSLEDIIKLVKAGSWQFTPVDAWATISPLARDLVASMLQREPSCRPGASQLLAHPWLTATPSQHSRNQLYCAVKEFKGEVAGTQDNAHLRTSWIRRSGVMRGALAQPTAGPDEANHAASNFPTIQAAGAQDQRSSGGLRDNPVLLSSQQVQAIKTPGSAFPTISAANDAVLGPSEPQPAISKEGQQLAMLQAQLNALKEKKGLLAVTGSQSPAGVAASERSSAHTSGSNARPSPDPTALATLAMMQEQVAQLQQQLLLKQRGQVPGGDLKTERSSDVGAGALKIHHSSSSQAGSGIATMPSNPAQAALGIPGTPGIRAHRSVDIPNGSAVS